MSGRATVLLRAAYALAAALGVTLAIVVATGAPPFATLAVMAQGGLGSEAAILRTLAAFTPLLLCGAALCVTFAANLWNIGVEGQITLGAIFAQGVLRAADPAGGLPQGLDMALGLGAAALGGMLWSLLAGVLRTHGRVHEIFSGLGLNFVAMGISLWLILGPWKRPGMASMSGTEPLDAALWLPALGGRPMSLVGPILAVVAFAAVAWLLTRTFFGLTLAAVRQNALAATRLGLRPKMRILAAMAICGALAGLAGGILVAGLYHRLIPSISGNYGYTAILAVLLASGSLWALPAACLFFAVLTVGSVQLPLSLSLDSSLAGVIQGVFVLTLFAARRLRPASPGRER
ncbi:ABC transporter permease [Solidesulfovibrio alcoholivorans]|uniref:ABC transporter permease n=1 Tax=Solidesulfovibrio alcoholivorans TaxID=81406 RepID=UPI000495EDEF|nr:ABC transporter permease [Solidesulfovibrio alcoholivorans]